MTPETKEIVRLALDNARGDGYERAKAAFRNCTPEQMQEQYGESGRTRQQMLDGYRQHVERIERAVKEMASL